LLEPIVRVLITLFCGGGKWAMIGRIGGASV
jgi:hypothetical protein